MSKERLLKELENLRATHKSAWEQYGSELCAREMIAKERELEDKIKQCKDE